MLPLLLTSDGGSISRGLHVVKLNPRSVGRSGVSSHSGSIFLVVEVLGPCLPLFLSVHDSHISLSISSVNGSLGSLNSNTVLGNGGSGWGVLEFFTFVGSSL